WVPAPRADRKSPPAHRHELALGIDRVERKISRRPYRAPHVVPGSRVADGAYHLKANASALEPFADGIVAVEELLCKRLVDDRGWRVGVGPVKVSPVDE